MCLLLNKGIDSFKAVILWASLVIKEAYNYVNPILVFR
jgi:hypothetical protein